MKIESFINHALNLIFPNAKEIEYYEETVTVYGFLKRMSVERKELKISESRNIIYLSVGKRKIAKWDSRCVNFQQEAMLLKFILSRK